MTKILSLVFALTLFIPGLFTFIPSNTYAAPCGVSIKDLGPGTLLFTVYWTDINLGDKYTFLLMEVGGGTLISEDFSRLTSTPKDDWIDPVLYYASAAAALATPLNLYPYLGKNLQLTLYRDPAAGGGICQATIIIAPVSCGACRYPEAVPASICSSEIQMVTGNSLSGCTGDSCSDCKHVPGCSSTTCFKPSIGGPGGPGKNPCPGGVCKTALGDIPVNPQEFATKILQIGTMIAGGLALILMVIGSIRVLTSSGDQQKLSGGRDMIVAAVAGLLFLIFSVLILRFIGISIVGL